MLDAGTARGALLPRDFFARPALEVAARLLGTVLAHQTAGGLVAVMLTEVEAYEGDTDPASHAYRGQTARNAVMFGPPGHAYVYFTYGMHFCVNLVCLREGTASAVLLRAGRVIEGAALAAARRPAAARERDLARGPARLCQALGITRAQNGLDVCDPASPLRLWAPAAGVPPAAEDRAAAGVPPAAGDRAAAVSVVSPVSLADTPAPADAVTPAAPSASDRAASPAGAAAPAGTASPAGTAPPAGTASPAGTAPPAGTTPAGAPVSVPALAGTTSPGGQGPAAPPGPGISQGPRVGVSAAGDRPWRFWLTADPTVSAYRAHTPRRPRQTG